MLKVIWNYLYILLFLKRSCPEEPINSALRETNDINITDVKKEREEDNLYCY